MSDSDEGEPSRWTRNRRLKAAFAAGYAEGGESDSSGSSESESDQEPPLQRRRIAESSSDGSSRVQDGGDSEENSTRNSSENSTGGHSSSESQQEEDGENGGGGPGAMELLNEANHDEGADNLQQGQDIGDVEAMAQGGAGQAMPQDGVGAAMAQDEDARPDSEYSSSESETEDSEGDNDSGDNEESSSDSEQSGEEDNEGDNEEDGDGAQADVPLYENARITQMESIMMILTFALTFSLSGQCLARLLELIELHCPQINRCVSTLYKFKKIFSDIGRNILVLHYFCDRCFSSLDGKHSVCGQCHNETEVAFFIEVPILNQLQRMFLRPGFLENLLYRFNRQKQHEGNIEDIYDGSLYKEHVVNNGLLQNRNNISFMFYTDGIAIFKSSKFSIWPLFFVVNELSYKHRTQKDNIILAGLWFGKRKPRPNLFLRPFRNFFETFRNQGYQFRTPGGQEINVKGILLCATCDLQAKGLFMRMKLSNGYYGCQKCKSNGFRVPAGRTTVHVHRYIPPAEMQLRDNDNIPALARGRQVGYKGLSLLYFLMPSMIKGMAIDIMHQNFLGLSKLLAKFWFSPAFSGEPFSCSRMVDVVNVKLSSISPPNFVQRFTRTLSDLKLWKAKEYKLWFFYYSVPVMSGVLENVYLHHYLKLVSAISLLSQLSISPEQIDAAEVLLNEFVRDFEPLYTVRFMGMNLHLLLHLANLVRELGPLWVYSCFFLEDLNGQIAKLIHGPHQVGLQVCSSASLFLSLKSKIDTLNPLSIAKRFCVDLRTVGSKFTVAESVSEKLKVIGRSAFNLHVSNDSIQIIRNKFQLVGGHFQSFYSLRKSGVVYTCAAKPRTTKRCSMYANFKTDNTMMLGKIKEFVRFSNCNCARVCLCVPAQHFCIIQVHDRIPWFVHEVCNVRIAYLTAVRPKDDVLCVPCSDLESVCFYMNMNDCEYLAIPINRLEYE